METKIAVSRNLQAGNGYEMQELHILSSQLAEVDKQSLADRKAAQADMLQALGCQRGQGLFFGRPMAFAELANCFSSALKPSAGL